MNPVSMVDVEERTPIEEGLFEWPADEPQLLGSECPACGAIEFPESKTCGNPDCDCRESTERTLLSTTGTLYSYTIHHTEHKEPYTYHSVPYGIGTVELPEGINLISKLTTADPAELEVGMEMEFTVDTLYEADETEYMTYFFEPTEEP